MGGACSTDGERRGVYRFLVGNLRKRDNWEDPGVDWRIFRWKWGVGVWNGLSWLRIETVDGHL
jgi:hypothetical protein